MAEREQEREQEIAGRGEGGLPSPGLADVADRLLRTAVPKVRVTPPAAGIRFDRNVAVPMRDGVILRVNVFRPDREGRFPVMMSAHPYGKDLLPAHTPFGYLPLKRYRFIRQPGLVTHSAYTAWEAPDPSFWVPRGYVVVNVDLRGFGTSGGVGALFSAEEAADYAQVIEWAAVQPWSNGRVGLNGVSYLAISQWRVAALRPKPLAAICPWEGWSDVYHDVAYPGGVREEGFIRFWANMTEQAGRVSESLRAGQLAHPEWDDFWEARTPVLEQIEVPALICGSFSDQGLHARGSFEGFRRIGSRHRFLYTHRGGKWSTYYSPEALALQARFFDCFLKGEDNGMREAAPVRLEIRRRAHEVHAARDERAWPPPGVSWSLLHLGPGELRQGVVAEPARVSFDVPEGGATFVFRAPDDFELVGPMKLRLHVELAGASDAHLFVAVSKVERAGESGRPRRRALAFEGPFGFGCDVVARGWLRVAHRRLDPARSESHRPFHLGDRAEPLRAGEIAAVDIEILPSATYFERGDVLRLDIRGRWFWRRSMFWGMFPCAYAPSPNSKVILHLGDRHDAYLLVPQVGLRPG
jgi:predicted acyl esterase